MTGIVPEVARQKVLGPAGTEVTLTIQRDGTEKPFDVKITRAKITIASVESKMLDNNVAYVKLNTFGDTTTSELKKALKTLLAQNPKGLILDLRNNGGGYLQTAVETSSQFVNSGVIVSEKYGDGRVDIANALPGGLALDIPMVVLVNEGSASASEIVAGALQDYGRAKLVGVTTYGKGSVQVWTPLVNDQGAARITIAKWLTPKDRTIDKLGLKPDVVVEMTEDDYKNNRDPQLDAAVKTLLEMVK
jgi:carboxyl-terminal processing protease